MGGTTVTEALANYTYEQALQQGPESPLVKAWVSIFNYKVPLTTTNKPFGSWEEYYGPAVRGEYNSTTPEIRNMTNIFSDLDVGLNSLDITGYGNRASKLPRTAPFEAQNIVVLTDGSCGSTCSIFSELLKSQGRVRSIAIGGRSKLGPMQGVGGTKGAQVYSLTLIRELLSLLAQAFPSLRQTVIGKMLNATRPFTRDARQGEATRINLRDMIRQ